MNVRRAPLPAVLLALLAAAASAQSPSKEPYNAKASPLDPLSQELLTETGYLIGEDGKVWDKIADEAVRRDEMSYLLSRLAGARRLKALLELELILNRSEGEKKLTTQEREAVRALVRRHWPVFGVGTRRDFRAYFSVEELETLNKIPPRFDRGSALLMRDPEPVTAAVMEAEAAAAPAAPSVPAAPALPATPAAPAASFYPKAVLTPFLEPLSLRRPSPFAPRRPPEPAQPVAPAPAAPVVSAPVVPAPVPVAPPPARLPPAPPAPAPIPAPAAPAPAPLPGPVAAPPIENPSLGTLKAWTPPSESPSTTTVPSAPAAAQTPPARAVEKPASPQHTDTTQAEFDAFVANGPYSREGQALLKMLAAKAPEFCRAILRRTVVRGTPLIVFDAARAGTDLRAGFAPAVAGAPSVIALSPGALLIERKSGLFGRRVIAVPEDPRAWAELGIAPPAIDPQGGKSRRAAYSPQQQAGELLERLLLLGLEREGYASSTYAARAWARSARLLFSAREADDYGSDAFLDSDRRLELRDWLERPDEADDMIVASWSSARGNVLDPRRGGPDSQARYERQARPDCARALLADHLAEAARSLAARARTLEALNDAGLVSADAAKIAAEKAAAEEAAARKALLAAPPSCDGRFGAEEAGLRRSAALLAEASRAERAFREKNANGSQHAPDQ